MVTGEQWLELQDVEYRKDNGRKRTLGSRNIQMNSQKLGVRKDRSSGMYPKTTHRLTNALVEVTLL